MNQPVPKRSKHDDTLIVDDVSTNSSNQATSSLKRDLKPQKRKIAGKPRQMLETNRSKRNRKIGGRKF